MTTTITDEETGKKWGFGEAGESPDTEQRITLDPTWTAKQLSLALIRANSKRLLAASLLLMMFGVASMLIPTVIGRVVDDVASPAFDGASFADLAQPLILWLGGLALLFVAMNIGFRFGSRIGWLGVQRGQYELSQAVIERVLSPYGFEGRHRAPGQLLAVATGDTQRACQVLYIMVYPPSQIVALVVAAVTLMFINIWLGIGVIIGLPIMLFLMHQAAKPLRARSMKEQRSLADAAGAAADLVSGFRVISGLHAQDSAAANYRGFSQTALRNTISARKAEAAFDGVTATGSQLVAVLVALAAMVMALEGLITPGELITATGVAAIMISPVQELVGTLGSMWAIAQASSQRVMDLISAEPNPATAGTVELDEDEHFLVFENLKLPGGTIKGINLDDRLEADEFIALKLPQSAASKLAEILTLNQVSEEGTVVLGGFDITALTPATLRKQLLVLPHRPGLLAGTALENIQLGGKDIMQQQAREALEVALLGEQELPDGLNTKLGDGAWELSGGQRQRIALARAIAADAKILVLIEPTTSVDAVTEELIATRLRARREGLLTIVISSSPAFYAVADRVLDPANPDEPKKYRPDAPRVQPRNLDPSRDRGPQSGVRAWKPRTR